VAIFDPFRAWFDSLGWLANAFGIAGSFVALVVVALRIKWQHFFGFSTFSKLAESKIAPSWRDSSPKELADIAIVDDNPDDLPHDELRREVAKVKVYRSVRLNDIETLAQHDLVFLDMHGVVRDDLHRGGLKLIRTLRERNPRQQICAVSSKTFDPTATEFFRLANDVKKKPMTAQDCSEVIGLSLKEKLDPMRVSAELDETLLSASGAARRRILREVQAYAESNHPPHDISFPEVISHNTDQRFRHGVADFIRMLRHAAA
jgi:hypothetical protein